MTFGTDPDAAVKCPECGAQLVVNLHGHRQFTCGREDTYLAEDAHAAPRVVSVLKPCRAGQIAAQMSAAEQHKLN